MKLLHGKNPSSIILPTMPWFLRDLSTYDIGNFMPVIITVAFGMKTLCKHSGGSDSEPKGCDMETI